jgi:catalase
MFKMQVMPLEDAPFYRFDPFDLTKVWLTSSLCASVLVSMLFSCRTCVALAGMVTQGLSTARSWEAEIRSKSLNYFAEIEQGSFSPGHMVPGIEASPDRSFV